MNHEGQLARRGVSSEKNSVARANLSAVFKMGYKRAAWGHSSASSDVIPAVRYLPGVSPVTFVKRVLKCESELKPHSADMVLNGISVSASIRFAWFILTGVRYSCGLQPSSCLKMRRRCGFEYPATEQRLSKDICFENSLSI